MPPTSSTGQLRTVSDTCTTHVTPAGLGDTRRKSGSYVHAHDDLFEDDFAFSKEQLDAARGLSRSNDGHRREEAPAEDGDKDDTDGETDELVARGMHGLPKMIKVAHGGRQRVDRRFVVRLKRRW